MRPLSGGTSRTDRRGPRAPAATGLHDSPASAPELAVTAQVRHEEAAARTHDEPALGWTVVLRRQPVRLADGRPEGGCTDTYELICCECGADPDLDYRDVAPLAPRDAVIHPSMGEACARFVRNSKAYRGLSPQSSESGGDRHVPDNPSGAGRRSQPL
jgi:hypothetical protein